MDDTHHQLTRDLVSHLKKLSIAYRCRKSTLSYGIWDSSLNMIEIVHQNRSGSKCFLSMGMYINSKLYIHPEEAIYMMQSSLLQVSLKKMSNKQSLPISFNEAYSLWFNRTSLTLKHLHVYQYLTRLGFILLRHRPNQTENQVKSNVSNRWKRKRDAYEHDFIPEQDDTIDQDRSICSVHSSIDCQRLWFPRYTDEPPIDVNEYSRLIFPDKFLPVHIDWLPSDYNSKVSQVVLNIYENRLFSARPSYSLIRSTDLQSHGTIYQRLTSLFSLPTEFNTTTSSNTFFDMHTPRKNFRRTQPDIPDYRIQIKDGNDEFNFHEIYNEQQSKTLTAIVDNGDVCFYLFKAFDPTEALR